MSKPVSYTSAVTVNIASFSGVTSNVATGAATTYPPSNGINSSANTSNYAIFNATSTSSGYAYYLFSSIEVPTIATINSVSCTIRTRTSSTDSGTSSFQLFAGSMEKGTQTTVTSTAVTAYNLTPGTSWTTQDIDNGIALRIGVRRALSGQSYSNYFYGATLTVNYSVDGINYEINASSETFLATIEPSSQEIFQGKSGIVKIETDNIGDIVVKDNGADVTSQLVVKQKIANSTIESYPISYTTGGSLSTGADVLGYCVGHSAENPTASTSNAYAKFFNTGYADYSFDFSSIPSNAIINNIEVRAYGRRENSNTGVLHAAKIGLYAGSTLKSAEQEFTSTSNQVITITNPGTWTREELQNAKLRFTVGYYGGYIGGATWVVNYTVPVEGNLYYYEYTINNISADHEIVVAEKVIVPPEEDPDKTYYPITISSINATTKPGRGTIRVESGTNQTITITPSDSQLTLALDNDVDISSQLVAHGNTIPDPIVETAPGASYGFNLNSSTGYYVSTNAGQSNSAAVARVTFNLPVRCLITIQYINYAEATYDYGIFGNIDTDLSTEYTADNKAYKILSSSSDNTSTPQTLTYEIESGEHFIDVKYRKDSNSNTNNDNLQFKITNIEELEPNFYYTYDLNNINQSHSLIFIFGDVTYYFITSDTSSNAKLYPNGQMVALPEDYYRLVIVPEKPTDIISLTDNGIDMTGNLERKEIQTEKEGQTITAVNYIYRLTNVQATHTLNVLSSARQILSVMREGTWISTTKVFKRDKKGWNEITDCENLFEPGKIYIPKQE